MTMIMTNAQDAEDTLSEKGITGLLDRAIEETGSDRVGTVKIMKLWFERTARM